MGNAAKIGRWIPALLLAFAAGCYHLPRPYSTISGARITAPPDTPRELQKVSLPDYIIEPPDILSIDAVTLVPHPPYRLHPLDVVKVTASGLPSEAAVSGELTVGIDGTLVLGFGYDKVGNAYAPLKVDGMSLSEVHDAIKKRLELIAKEADVSITLVKIAAQQSIAGEHLVCPDGTVNLGAYGRVRRWHDARRSPGRHRETPLQPFRSAGSGGRCVRLQQQSLLRGHPRRRSR